MNERGYLGCWRRVRHFCSNFFSQVHCWVLQLLAWNHARCGGNQGSDQVAPNSLYCVVTQSHNTLLTAAHSKCSPAISILFRSKCNVLSFCQELLLLCNIYTTLYAPSFLLTSHPFVYDSWATSNIGELTNYIGRRNRVIALLRNFDVFNWLIEPCKDPEQEVQGVEEHDTPEHYLQYTTNRHNLHPVCISCSVSCA